MHQVELFWKYVTNFTGEAPLEVVFSNYVQSSNITSSDAKVLWEQVEKDIDEVFVKHAVTTVYPDGKIVIDSDSDSESDVNDTTSDQQNNSKIFPDNTISPVKNTNLNDKVVPSHSPMGSPVKEPDIAPHIPGATIDKDSSESNQDKEVLQPPKNVFDLAYQNISKN